MVTNFGNHVATVSGGASPGAFVVLQTAPEGILFLVLGVVILGAAIGDLLWTTLWGDKGAGLLSSRLMIGIWRGLRSRTGDRSWVLSLAGPLILVLHLVVWVGFIWAGWVLVFASGESALVPTRGPGPVTWTGRIYFVAQAMFTMGNGDFYLSPGVWQVTASLTTASGILSVTLIVAYLISVLDGIVSKRSFADSVLELGDSGEAFVRRGWSSGGFRQFDIVLDTLSLEVSHLAAQHKIHPILHYYRSSRARHSQALAITVFDEALTLLRFGVPDEQRPNDALLEMARSNTQSYLEAFTDTVDPADRTPPAPDLDRLREAGIPTVSDEEFADALDDLEERRRQLLAVVEDAGWDWPAEDV